MCSGEHSEPSFVKTWKQVRSTWLEGLHSVEDQQEHCWQTSLAGEGLSLHYTTDLVLGPPWGQSRQ